MEDGRRESACKGYYNIVRLLPPRAGNSVREASAQTRHVVEPDVQYLGGYVATVHAT